MARPYALLRSGFPYYMTLGQRRVTSNPVDIGFGEENVYVLTRGGLGTEVRVINWEDENLGLIGTGNFTWPTALLVDEDENLYVSDEAKHNVTVMDKDGTVLDTWGEHGSEDGQLDRPSSMQFDGDGNIVVSDTMNHRIQRFTRDGTHLQTIDNGHGSDEGELNMPWGVALDELGDVYVADWRNDRVQKFNADGEFVMSIGSKGDDKGQFNRPASIAVDAHGDIYVADWLERPGADVQRRRPLYRTVHRRRQPFKIGSPVHPCKCRHAKVARDGRLGARQAAQRTLLCQGGLRVPTVHLRLRPAPDPDLQEGSLRAVRGPDRTSNAQPDPVYDVSRV